MRILLRGDTQADRSNLDLCQISIDETLRWAKKYAVDAVVELGDLKDAYDPVAVDVIKFWVSVVRRFRRENIRFIVLLGNHDRTSQSADAKNWFSILAAAGAEVVTKPLTAIVNDTLVAFLPFTSDKVLEKKWAADLSQAGAAVLLFHTEIAGAEMGYLTSKAPITPQSLCMDDYMVCVGGHIHKYQKVQENVFYCGSPFCQDWGEVNQTKGQLLLTVEHDAFKLQRLRTRIPGWYDAEYLDAYGITPEPGAYIRSKVTVASKKLTSQLGDEEKRLAELYPGARIYAVPHVEESSADEVPLAGSNDAALVSQYVAHTFPEGARFDSRGCVNFMLSKLRETGIDASGRAIRFKKMGCTGAFSFAKVECSLDALGLVLVQGRNYDWPKRSNGAGKTNLLSIIPTAWFGRSTKGQTADDWKNERLEGASDVWVEHEDERGRRIRVERRRPHSLKLLVNGEDRSSGIRGTGRVETQGEIERRTGFDFRLLTNSVYIDQTIANGFVFGTQSTRLNLIEKIQNLERYEQALKLVKRDIERNREEQQIQAAHADAREDEIQRLQLELDACVQTSDAWVSKAAMLKKRLASLQALQAQLAALKTPVMEAGERIKADLKTLNALRAQLVQAEADHRSARQLIERGKSLQKAQRCPTCGQPTEGIGATMVDAYSGSVVDAAKRIEDLSGQIEAVEANMRECAKVVQQSAVLRARIEQMGDVAQELLDARNNAAAEQARNMQLINRRREVAAQLQSAKRMLQSIRRMLRDLDVDMELLEYVRKAFQRTGMPLYLSAAMCPVLNKAADEFAELFFSGQQKIRFAVRDGEFVVDILNAAGSGTADGQSVGESAMAGIVAAFALREATTKTNLLIVDEPGHGLDDAGARQFARGLLQLKGRYDSILITTHHPAIASVLSGETIWTVEKNRGISRLCTIEDAR